MDASRVHRIREDYERAEARRLQPHYIESFPRSVSTPRWHVETARTKTLRDHARPRAYETAIVHRLESRFGPDTVAFEKSPVGPIGTTAAAYVFPGHPLLDSTIDLTLERHRDLLRREPSW
jgi:hypothetical protein